MFMTDSWSRTLAIPILIHLYQKIIGPASAFESNFQASETPHVVAGVEQRLNHAVFRSAFATQTPPHNTVYESPLLSEPAAFGQPRPTALALWERSSSHLELPQLSVPQSPLPPLPASFGQPEPTEMAFWDQYGPQLGLIGQTPTSQSVPNILLGSTPLKRTFETSSEAPTSKRVKPQVPLDQHPPISLNYIPSTNELAINAHSQPFEAPLTASTVPNYPMDQFRHGPELVHPMVYPTFLDHRVRSYQTSAHQPNNLKQNNNHHLDYLMITPHRQVIGLDDKPNHETARAWSDRAAENGESSGRAKCQSGDPTTLRHAPTTLTKKSQDQPFLVVRGIKYRWVDFKPSTIHGRLVTQVMQNFRFRDGANFLNLSVGPNHAQVLDNINQNQFSQKMFCLESSITNIEKSFELLYQWAPQRLTKSDKDSLVQKTRSRFMARYGHPEFDSTHQPDIWKYKETVLSEFKSSSETYWDTVANYLDEKKIITKRLKIFKTEMKHFPIYLFYVDLISALVPVEDLDVEGNLLQRQREIAAKSFFDLIQEVFLDDKKGDLKYNRSDEESTLIGEIKKMQSSANFGARNHFFSFVWKALEYWIATSREDLQQITVGGCFKRFINKMVQSWAAKD